MRKFIAIVAAASFFTACNSEANTEAPATADSCAVDSCKVDSCKKSVADTTAVVDTTKTAK